MFICGQAGSGKSFLADALLNGVRAQKLIIDVKAMFEHKGAYLVETVRDLEKFGKKGADILFQPHLGDWDAVDAAFHWAYHRGGVTVYNDERGGWGRPWEMDLLPWEAHAVMRGRARNVAVWTGTQRPSRIPVALMSESEHFFVFRLQNGDDRKKVAAYAGSLIAGPPLPKRWFWYSGPETDEPALMPPLKDVIRRKVRRGV